MSPSELPCSTPPASPRPPLPEPIRHPQLGLPLTVWWYRDATGAPLSAVARFGPPDGPKQIRPLACIDGRWQWKAPAEPRPLYGLDRLAARPGAPVLLVEGEKTADAAAVLFPGYVAMTWQSGAKAISKADWGPLKGRTVTVWPDHDQPGREAAAAAVQAMTEAGANVTGIVTMPADWPDGWDLADPPPESVTPKHLETMLEAVWIDETLTPTVIEPDQRLLLNPKAPLDSAKALLRIRHTLHGKRTLHHHEAAFYVWQRTHYRELTADGARAMVYSVLDDAWRKDRMSGAIVQFDPTRAKVADVLDALSAECHLPREVRPPAWLESSDDPPALEIIACRNGLLHLPTQTIRPHTPAFFTLNALAFDYEPTPPPPVEWLRFLTSVWPDDPEVIATLQEMVGLLLTPDTSHQKAFLIVGPKRSGKGTIARVLGALIGADNMCSPTLGSLATNFGMAPLIGCRLAMISDARLSGKPDQGVIVERLLSVTGEDAQTIDRKFLTPWHGKLDARFLMLTNELPRLTDSSGALSGRFIVITMTRSFYGQEDHGLSQRLIAELPGILGWAIEGWQRLRERGRFVQPQSSADAIRELDDLGSAIGAFLRDCCETGPGHTVRCDELYKAWCDWCTEVGRDHPGTQQVFGRDLRAAVAGLHIIRPRDTDRRQRFYGNVGFTVAFASRPR